MSVVPAWDDHGAAFAASWRAERFGVIGWGRLGDGDPVAIADVAVFYCAAADLDGYVLNAEDEAEGVNRWRLRQFLERFRALAPHAPLAISNIGGAYSGHVRDYDYQAVVELANVFMPQCFPNHDGLTVTDCIAHCDRVGLGREIVVPTIGCWDGPYGRYEIGEYVREVDAADTLGVNVFRAELVLPHELMGLGAGVRERRIAL